METEPSIKPKKDKEIKLKNGTKKLRSEIINKLLYVSALTIDELNKLTNKELSDMWSTLDLDTWINFN